MRPTSPVTHPELSYTPALGGPLGFLCACNSHARGEKCEVSEEPPWRKERTMPTRTSSGFVDVGKWFWLPSRCRGGSLTFQQILPAPRDDGLSKRLSGRWNSSNRHKNIAVCTCLASSLRGWQSAGAAVCSGAGRADIYQRGISW